MEGFAGDRQAVGPMRLLSDSWVDQLKKLEPVRAQGGGYEFGGWYQTYALISWDVAAEEVVL